MIGGIKVKSILDPSFKYKSSATHTSSDAFHRRQLARRRLAMMQAKRRERDEQQVIQMRPRAGDSR